MNYGHSGVYNCEFIIFYDLSSPNNVPVMYKEVVCKGF